MNRWTRNLLIAITVAGLGWTGLSAASGQTPMSAPPGMQASAVAVPAVQTEFVPVQPCRVADTRHGGNALGNNIARNFYIRGTFGFAPQGGISGGCGIPVGASGVTANVTITGATTAGYLSGYPAGTAEPTTNFVTYQSGQTTTANPTFSLSAPAVDPQLTMKNHGSPVQVIIDVTGYYTPSISGSVNADGSLLFHSSRVLASAYDPGSSAYIVQLDRDISTCAISATPERSRVGYVLVGPGGSGTTAIFLVRNSLGNATTAQFYFNVAC